MHDVSLHVECVVPPKVGKLERRVVGLLSVNVKKTCQGESDALKVLLAGIETRFREEPTVLVEAVNEHNHD